MITVLALMSAYGEPTANLDQVCERYFGLSRAEAMRQAARGELPVKVFRVGKSQKAPYLVCLQALAKLLDDANAEAEKTWQRSQI